MRMVPFGAVTMLRGYTESPVNTCSTGKFSHAFGPLLVAYTSSRPLPVVLVASRCGLPFGLPTSGSVTAMSWRCPSEPSALGPYGTTGSGGDCAKYQKRTHSGPTVPQLATWGCP